MTKRAPVGANKGDGAIKKSEDAALSRFSQLGIKVGAGVITLSSSSEEEQLNNSKLALNLIAMHLTSALCGGLSKSKQPN